MALYENEIVSSKISLHSCLEDDEITEALKDLPLDQNLKVEKIQLEVGPDTK